MPADSPLILRLSERPDLVPVVAGWLWEEFLHWDGYTLEGARDILVGLAPPFRTLVMLRDGKPVGTASLTAEDLDERPQLSPWLAGVYVVPQARGQGVARALVAAVVDAAGSAGFATLWLYTGTSAGLYAKLGWHATETVERGDKPAVTLMRRDLT